MPQPQPTVAIIIPAFNEEGRIAGVARAAKGSTLAHEVIVVNDGSADRTTAEAQTVEGVRVVDLKVNQGKGGAMVAGAKATNADIICFVDADLEGIQPRHIDQIIRPMLMPGVDMCIGVFRGGTILSDAGQRAFPYVSGQRALHRKVFLAIPYVSEMRFGVEMTLTNWAKRSKAQVVRVVLRGVSNCHKEKKLGVIKGSAARIKMYSEMYRAVKRTRKRNFRKWRGLQSAKRKRK